MTTLEVEPVRIRTEEYDRMTEAGVFDGRHIDLLEGTLYEMPPMRTSHLVVLVRLQQMLASLNAQRRLLVQIPLRVPEFDEPEPDLAVLREPLGRRKPTAADSLLVIEVSDSTLRFDRERKLPAYRRGGVDEVWIVNVPDLQLEVTDALGTRVFRPVDRSAPTAAGVTVDLAVLFSDLGDDQDRPSPAYRN
ncbi:MAG: Uma2 family endonuclease [Chloroflexota bacterium]|nr:Uma2 family endonuclease [Chloroflexota bacterium]